METFENISSKNTLRWYLPNIRFCEDECLAISSLNLSTSQYEEKCRTVLIRCPLITADHFNSDGSILCCSMANGVIDYRSGNHEFWPIDSSRPRYIDLVMEGARASDVEFVGLVLVIT